MANPEYDFAIGRYALKDVEKVDDRKRTLSADVAELKAKVLEIGPDGPNRLQGHTTYSSYRAAASSAESYLRKVNSHKKLTIFRVDQKEDQSDE